MRAIWAAVWLGGSGLVAAATPAESLPEGMRPTQIGVRAACLGCDAATMEGVARGIGPGTHLIVDARGKVGRKYAVVCAGDAGPPPVLAQMPQPCPGLTVATELPLDEVERRHFKGLVPYLGGGGHFRIQQRVNWTAHSSVYRLSEGPISAEAWELRDQFLATFQAQHPELGAEPLAWLQQWLPMSGPSELLARVVFPDRSEIVVEVDLQPLFNLFGTAPIEGWNIELDKDSAKDGDGQPVPGWSWVMPSTAGTFEVERTPSNAADFEFLMGRLGFQIVPEPGGQPGERYRCLVREETDKSGKPYAAKVCLRGEAAAQYSAPPPVR